MMEGRICSSFIGAFPLLGFLMKSSAYAIRKAAPVALSAALQLSLLIKWRSLSGNQWMKISFGLGYLLSDLYFIIYVTFFQS